MIVSGLCLEGTSHTHWRMKTNPNLSNNRCLSCENFPKFKINIEHKALKRKKFQITHNQPTLNFYNLMNFSNDLDFCSSTWKSLFLVKFNWNFLVACLRELLFFKLSSIWFQKICNTSQVNLWIFDYSLSLGQYGIVNDDWTLTHNTDCWY